MTERSSRESSYLLGSFSNAVEPGSRHLWRWGGGRRRVAGGPGGSEPDTPRGGEASWARRISCDWCGELEAESLQDLSPARCSQHAGVVRSTMTHHAATSDLLSAPHQGCPASKRQINTPSSRSEPTVQVLKMFSCLKYKYLHVNKRKLL